LDLLRLANLAPWRFKLSVDNRQGAIRAKLGNHRDTELTEIQRELFAL